MRFPPRILFLFFLLLNAGMIRAQECRSTNAVRTGTAPKIDGSLDDAVWANVPVSTDFIQLKPNPGQPSRRQTEVKVIYDDEAVYVGAMMYDNADSILKQLGVRDEFDEGNTDLFAVLFGTYNDNQHAFVFSVSAAGVQSDFKVNGDDFDSDWNGVWQSGSKMLPNGWSAEIKIPYSAIRFPKTRVQTWQLNFSRIIRRYREFSNWNNVSPEKDGIVNQCGKLNGIENIVSPLRLSLSPYVSAYAENYPYDIPGKSNTTYLLNGGMDLKYGLSESFTMDMTLVPDFGQVQSDNRVLNLTPFEVFYNEKRSFFTEGTELFGLADIFYSRRIGGMPVYHDQVYDQLTSNEAVDINPTQSRLYNATKISGRTRTGLGIGMFNATSAPVFASIRDTLTGATRKLMTQPLTNYNVTVFDQTFNKNSHFAIINSNVMRDGDARDANVTGSQFKLADKKNNNALQAYGAVSQVWDKGAGAPIQGYKYVANIGKISGNYQVSLVHKEVSPTYDQNDLGYLPRNNEFNFYLNQSYNVYKPFWIINKMSNDMGIDYLMLYSPRAYRVFNVDFNSDIDFKNYFTLGTFWTVQPFKRNFDYYAPRVPGRYYAYSDNYDIGNYFSTDYRKKFALDGSWDYYYFNERNRHYFNHSLGPRYRFSDRFTMKFVYSNQMLTDDVGFVDSVNDTIIFGVRKVNTIDNELTASYIFTNHMSLSLRARHYWSKVVYSDFFSLQENGEAGSTTYHLNNNIDFSAFNIDMVYTWQFSPGSEMSIVWKNAIYTEKSEITKRYFESLNKTIDSPQTNSFSIKVLYYLDYQVVKKAITRGRSL
jgi:hypothetical protein